MAALERFEAVGLHVTARSRWYESEPVPKSAQPNFINAVVRVETTMTPAALMAVLQRVEKDFGRTKGVRNAARCIDLDLIAYGDKVTRGETVPLLPHPRMHERAFVLMPLRAVSRPYGRSAHRSSAARPDRPAHRLSRSPPAIAWGRSCKAANRLTPSANIAVSASGTYIEINRMKRSRNWHGSRNR